jgi:hypothetical protein
VDAQESLASEAVVLGVLGALGGEGTLGDVMVLSGLPHRAVELGLDALLADGRAEVRVTRAGEVVYHLGPARGPLPGLSRWVPRGMPVTRMPLYRKTLRLIRAREGVLSVAELVEHTGLPLEEAEKEMLRLADWYGGEPRAALDGFTVWVFPALMTSVHGRFALGEPRPAWVRFEDPVHPRGPARPRRPTLKLGLWSLGTAVSLGASAVAVTGLATGGLAPAVLLAVSGVAAVVLGTGLIRAVRRHRVFRFREKRSLRRYALGYVVETALAGKGVVSLERTVKYVQSRAGKTRVSRRGVEAALRDLAREFDAPASREGEDLFFGFRNLKRQYLASVLERRRLQLARLASGDAVFDTADSPGEAGARELATFDRDLEALGREAGARRLEAPEA